MMMGKKLLRWWNEPEASDGESAKKNGKVAIYMLTYESSFYCIILILCYCYFAILMKLFGCRGSVLYAH